MGLALLMLNRSFGKSDDLTRAVVSLERELAAGRGRNLKFEISDFRFQRRIGRIGRI